MAGYSISGYRDLCLYLEGRGAFEDLDIAELENFLHEEDMQPVCTVIRDNSLLRAVVCALQYVVGADDALHGQDTDPVDGQDQHVEVVTTGKFSTAVLREPCDTLSKVIPIGC